MAALTLTEARTLTRTQHLDDDSTRWSDAEVDLALKGALSLCMDEYLSRGGEHYAEEVDSTTDSSSELDLSTYNPLKIHAVSHLRGTRYYPLAQSARGDKRRDNQTGSQSVRVFLTRSFDIPSGTPSNPLIGDTVSPPEYPAFEQWVCARAAMTLATKDDERLQALENVEAMHRNAVFNRLTRTSSRRPHMRAVWWSQWMTYDYEPRSQKIALTNRGPLGIF